ncbi:MAG TPA: NAD(P)H-hydrate dehydratase [Beutenbergiaceae bacterium]|nr:NAD(P)H-hydrate dehydratase [Beutenbergiaceae bacterium]
MIRGYDAQAVRQAEAPALAAGVPLMRNAAFALANHIAAHLRVRSIPVPGARALVLVGGGNNGGDGLFAAADLRARGLQVTCLLVHQRPHADGLAAARRAGVRIIDLSRADTAPAEARKRPAAAPKHPADARADPEEAALPAVVAGWGAWADVWVDAMAGIGVQGALRDLPARVVEALTAVRAGSPGDPLVVAVDTPSGIGADIAQEPVPEDGVLRADLTVTMGAPKAGLLVPPGSRYAGGIEVVDLGLNADFLRRRATVNRLTAADVADLWPVPAASDHKYTRGVVGLYAGSPHYPGAALLCARAAAGVGAGMVRYLGHPDVAAEVVRANPEVVTANGRVQSLVIGPGMPNDDEDLAAAMRLALRSWGLGEGAEHEAEIGGQIAVVLDAGALDHVPDAPETLAAHPVLLTPHAGELQRLLDRLGVHTTRGRIEADPWRWAHTAARRTGATVLLKGAITVVAPPAGAGYSQDDGSPWLATAGSGDVLAGILGAMLAQATEEELARGEIAARAAAAVVVHGRAAGLVGAPLRSPHLARAVPEAIATLL